jgi:DNA polymerase-3 subunit alpha
MAAAVETAWGWAQKQQADIAAGQSSLFGGGEAAGHAYAPALPTVDAWSRGEQLRHERDLMGFYVSGHPLDDYAAESKAFATVKFGESAGVMHESDVTGIGIVTDVVRKTSKSGRPMAFVTIEDTTGTSEVVLFAQSLERCGHLLVVDDVLLVRGKAETTRGDLKIIGREVIPMWRVRETLVKALVLKLDADIVSEADVEALAVLCEANKGTTKVYMELTSRDLPRPVRLHARTAVVDLTPDFMKSLNKIVGARSVVLEGEG